MKPEQGWCFKMVTEAEKQRQIKTAEECVSTGSYGIAEGWYEKIGDTEKAKECCIKQAEACAIKGSYMNAGNWYEKGGEMDKAKEYWVKLAEECAAKGAYHVAEGWYEKIGDTEKAKECCIKQAEACVSTGSYSIAGGWYEKVGLLDKAVECWTKVYFDKKDYEGMITMLCKRADFSLSQIPKDMRGGLLELVRKGNVRATQSLAKLVKTEEDELMFNEARAGMVL
jgi:tetratricopeptide (TPR) repeat protein